jgi:hypothetical protein
MVRRSRRRLPRQPRQRHPLDRLAVVVIAGLALAITALVLSGDHAIARVREFTWQDRQVGAEDRAFVITFSRPMDPTSVEENLAIDPPLPGRVSWAGRRMAYTLDYPIPYGQSFKVSLGDALDRFSANLDEPVSQFQPFEAEFQTRDRGFLYIGVDGDEANRLVLADLQRQERIILTPRHLSVLNFIPYPLGDRVLFSASDTSHGGEILSQQLYTVTTGIHPHPPYDLMGGGPSLWQRLWQRPTAQAESGELQLVLDNDGYQNLKFDLSPDGQTIVVQRVNQQNPADFGPWVIRQGQPAKPLATDPGGDFLIAPDSQSLVMLQGEGTAIIDLEQEAQTGPSQPLDFLPDYGRVFDLSADGSAAAMVNYNQNDPERRFMESLFLVTNQGQEEELLQVSGAILDAKFDSAKQFLYVLASEVVADTSNRDAIASEAYVEQPMLLAINLQAMAMTKLLRLPQQQRINMSLAPDGLSLLLDLDGQVDADPVLPPEAGDRSSIWHIPLFTDPDERNTSTPSVIDPEQFPFHGLQATWLP